MSQAENATRNSGHPLNLYDLEPAVPDANTLLSLKLLQDADADAFGGLAQRSTIWLSSALALLRHDKFLQIKFGGDNINAAMQLAPILKQRAEEKHIQSRMDAVSGDLANYPFNAHGALGEGLKPVTAGTVLNLGAAGARLNMNPAATNAIVIKAHPGA